MKPVIAARAELKKRLMEAQRVLGQDPKIKDSQGESNTVILRLARDSAATRDNIESMMAAHKLAKAVASTCNVECGCQTETNTVEKSCQTDFSAPLTRSMERRLKRQSLVRKKPITSRRGKRHDCLPMSVCAPEQDSVGTASEDNGSNLDTHSVGLFNSPSTGTNKFIFDDLFAPVDTVSCPRETVDAELAISAVPDDEPIEPMTLRMTQLETAMQNVEKEIHALVHVHSAESVIISPLAKSLCQTASPVFSEATLSVGSIPEECTRILAADAGQQLPSPRTSCQNKPKSPRGNFGQWMDSTKKIVDNLSSTVAINQSSLDARATSSRPILNKPPFSPQSRDRPIPETNWRTLPTQTLTTRSMSALPAANVSTGFGGSVPTQLTPHLLIPSAARPPPQVASFAARRGLSASQSQLRSFTPPLVNRSLKNTTIGFAQSRNQTADLTVAPDDTNIAQLPTVRLLNTPESVPSLGASNIWFPRVNSTESMRTASPKGSRLATHTERWEMRWTCPPESPMASTSTTADRPRFSAVSGSVGTNLRCLSPPQCKREIESMPSGMPGSPPASYRSYMRLSPDASLKSPDVQKREVRMGHSQSTSAIPEHALPRSDAVGFPPRLKAPLISGYDLRDPFNLRQ